MPPATAATTMVSLRELADLAIGTPEVGAVNFTALHTLIVAMLRSLNLQEVRIDFQSPLPSPETSRTLEIPQTALSAPQLAASREKPRGSLTKPPTAAATLESQVKGLGGQVQDLSRKLKTVTSQVQGIVSHVQHLTAPISELDARDWLEEETAKLAPARARAGSLKTAKGERATVSQVSQAMELLRDVVEDVKTLKEAQEKAQELPATAFQRIDALEKIVRERDEFLDLVGRKMSLMPVGEEVTMVTWEELEQAITDGWRASLGVNKLGSETTTGLPQRRGHASAMSDDILQGGVPIKRSSADRAVDSPRAYGSDQTFSGLGGIRNPSEGVTREQGRGASAAAFPAREQHPRARDEAGLAKTHHPSASQSRVESDRPRTRELPLHSSAHLRKEEREAQPGPTLQDLSSGPVAGDELQGHPDQHWGVDASLGRIQPGPDQHRLGPHGVDPLAWQHPRTYPHAVVPHSVGQLGVMPPGMDEWGLVTPGPDQYGMVPPVVPGTHQQGWELPSPVQPGTVPPGAYQYDTGLPGTAQQPGVDPRGWVPLAADQRGFLIPGVDQQGLVPHLTHQRGLASPGLMQVVADRQGFVQPSLETSEFTHPHTDQHDIIQPGPDQHGLVPAGAGQRGLVQPGADRHGLVQTLVDPSGLVQPGADLPDWAQPGAYPSGWGQPVAYPFDSVQPNVYPSGLVQPSAVQPGLTQSGIGQQDSAQLRTDQRTLVEPEMDEHGLVQVGMDHRVLFQPGTVRPTLMQPGAGQRGLVQPVISQRDLAVQPGIDQRESFQLGMDQRGLVQPGLVQPGMDQRGLVQPGAGQPGMDQRGLVQRGAGQPGLAQPGMDQRGLVQPGACQPGMDQRGLVQRGAGQPGLAQPGMDQRGLVQPGTGQPGLAQPGMDQRGLVQPGMGQPGLAQPGMDQRGLMQPGTGQPGLVQPGMDQRGLVQPGTGQPGLVQPGMDQRGLVQPGLAQPGMDQRGLVQRGIGQPGLAQPGMDQRGLVQPGTGQPGLAQPGMDQRGLVQPGTGQPGMAQPGMDQRGLVQPGAGQPGIGQRGLLQPGTGQPALVQPGMDQHGLVQPGTGQPALVQPGMDHRGFVQPGAGQPGLAQPGIDQRGLVQRGTGRPGSMQPGTDHRGLAQPGVAQPGLVQPGIDQHGLVQPGAGQPGLAPPGMDHRDLVQPGAGQPGLAHPGMDHHGLVHPGVGQPGLAQPGMDQRGLVQTGTGQPGLAQPGMDQRGLMQTGTGQPGLAQPGMDQRGLVQPGAGQPVLAQPSMDQRGLVQPGTGQPGLAQPGMDQRGLVQPGTGQPGSAQPGMDQHGLVQPGMGQPGSAQPGMDQRGLVQPGAGQPGSAQPGMDHRGLVQPGAGQPGLAQPGMDQRGLVQPGAGQPHLAQPGMDHRGLVQPGAGQPGLAQPGMDQRGLVQPGAGQPGLAQPGMDQRGLVQPGSGQPGLTQPGMDQRGLVQPGTGQPGLVQPVLDQRGLVQPGAGQPGLVRSGIVQPALVQPGAGQGGLVQPGTDQLGLGHRGVDQRGLVQAGTDPRGFSQPGAYPPGLIQPGAYPLDLVQPGAYPRGLVQPGAYPQGLGQSSAYPRGSIPPGAYPRGLIQPGTYPHSFMQPSTDQRGLVQPEIDQYGLRQPGTGQPGVIPAGTGLRGFPAFPPDFPRSLAHPYHPGVIPPGRYQHGQVSTLLANQGLASPGIGQKGLSETYQQGLLHRGTDQHGLTPLSPHVGSVQRAQQHLVSPGPDQHGQGQAGTEQQDHVSSIPESWDRSYPGPHGPDVLGVDPRVQMGLDPKQIHASGQPAFPRSADSLSDLHGVSSEKSDFQSERRDSLDKLAPTFPMAVETFRLMGELLGLYVELKENMKELDEEQAGQTDLEKIQYLLGLMVKKAIPPDLQEQLNTLKSLTKEVRQEKAKMERMQKILEGNGEHGTGKDMKNGSLSLQLGILRVTVADIEKELAELRESQERGKVSMEHSVSEASLYLQDQLDKLRAIIENMLASSSTLLSLSMAPHKTLSTLEPGQIDPEATCPACSLDLSHQVSTLVQRYEQLQDMVNNLAASRPSKKAKLQSQDEELLGHVQSAILQVQGDCEKLYITTSSLIEDHRQKQKDIDVLYQGIEKLEKEKANREHLEMEIDVKADKSALAAKVSRVQFDATTEQLNHMMQELVAKMSDHEQDWQKMLDKLLVEMDSKLDRLELDPVKKLLEDRWKSLRQQLKERSPLYQADEAAAMRRQLLAHFHCLSCDRPLETAVTGQFIPVTPVGPALPGHRSTRPYTIFELEQVRQQSRNLKLGGTAFPRGDLAHMERSVGRLRTMHSKMLMDIEKVQIHFGGSVRASSQMIRELLQAQCLSSPCYKRVPETADYVYSSVPRRCGGSHTLTYPYRRSRLQHLSQGLYPTEEVQIAMKHDEVDILGLDGHIYKGRMDTRLPGILTKDTSISGMSKHKAKHSRPHVHRQQSLSDNGLLPSRPQSAQMLAVNSPAPPRPRKDRPLSSEGRLAQPNTAHPPSPSELEMHMDMPPGEGPEEPTRGPRSTTAQ
ncbi:glutamine-rich protein 2 isoform X8 [Mustela erminea]|uniref:glutamine-rich protein 2 isoform X8 n=1 Tax=Mustela erminea TaxID=36723 RepID=UPI001386D1C4|nr:glutamine-rich protein 2 isoform X8 [Mustela erminea]